MAETYNKQTGPR